MDRVSLIIDANLLVLFVVGATDRNLIARHKRLKAFSLEDFDLLCRLVVEADPESIVQENCLHSLPLPSAQRGVLVLGLTCLTW